MDRQAEIVEAAIRRAGGPVHLVGHSYGALVCLDVALCGLMPLISLTLIEPVAFGLLRQAGEFSLYEQFVAMREDYFRSFEDGKGKRHAGWSIISMAREALMPCRPGCASILLTRRRPMFWTCAPASIRPSRRSATFCFRPELSGANARASLERSADILSGALANASLNTIAGARHFMTSTHAAELAELIGDHVMKTESLAWSGLSFASPWGFRSRDSSWIIELSGCAFSPRWDCSAARG